MKKKILLSLDEDEYKKAISLLPVYQLGTVQKLFRKLLSLATSDKEKELHENHQTK